MTRRNQSLDLLRGVAILLVVLVHCQEESTGVVPGLSWFAKEYGGLGVQLFFIVSGYTMMLTYGDRLDLAAARSFYLRRFFRIAPLFWVAIVFYLLVTRGRGITNFAPDGVGVSDVLLTFFFLHSSSVTAYNSVVPGGWSIAVEMQFYLLFPLLIYLFRRRNGAMLCYALIALVSVIGQFVVEPYLIPRLAASLPASQAYLAEGVFTSWLPRQAICFGFGILLYDYIELKNRPAFGALFLLGAALVSPPQGAEIALLAAFALRCPDLERLAVVDDGVGTSLLRHLSRSFRRGVVHRRAPPVGPGAAVRAGLHRVAGVQLLSDRAPDRTSLQPAGPRAGVGRWCPESRPDGLLKPLTERANWRRGRDSGTPVEMNLPTEIVEMLGQTLAKVVPVTIALALVFSVLAHFWACNPGRPWWRKRELVTDVCYWFLVPLFARVFRIGLLVLGAALVFGIRDADELIAFYDNGHGPLSRLPLWLQAILFLVAADFMMYWLHRMFHGGGFWKYHAIHHSSEDVDWISAARFHPVNLLLGTIGVDVVLLMAGISPGVMLWLGPFNIFHSAFVHANLNWTLGPFKYVVATPVFHRWHHTSREEGGDTNFAGTFPLWDILFGTFRMPKGTLPDQYGVDDQSSFPREIIGQLAYPFRK